MTRSGTQLMLDGQAWKASGPNIYWLGLDENGRIDPQTAPPNYSGVLYPTHWRVVDALKTVALMGGTVVRAHTLGVSTGNSKSLEPALGVYNEAAFEPIDFALKTAHDLGIRFVIPFTDNWAWYHGGYHNWTDWLGLSKTVFYTNPAAIAAFEDYISHLLNHVNQYTGVALKDDPTIAAWETGNELSSPPAAWTEQIADFVKHTVGAQQLFMDGTYGINSSALAAPDVDIYSDHFYGMSLTKLNTDVALTSAAGKVYSAGEYAWTGQGQSSGTTLANFLAAIETNPAIGMDQYWSLFPRNDDWGYVQHFDNYTLHYSGDTADFATRIGQLRAHAYAMSGLSVPAYPTPEAPVITKVEHRSTGNLIEWRGTYAADTYSVDRSVSGPAGLWTTVCNACASTDKATPWLDAGATDGPEIWYRVWAINKDSVAGPYSDPFRLSAGTFFDPLTNYNLVFSRSSNTTIDTANSTRYYNDAARAARTNTSAATLVWHVPGMKTFELVGYFGTQTPNTHFRFATSADGLTFTPVPADQIRTHIGVRSASSSGFQYKWVYTIEGLQNTAYMQVSYQSGSTATNPEIGEVSATYVNTGK